MNATYRAAVLSAAALAAALGVGVCTVLKVDRATRPAHEVTTPKFVAMNAITTGSIGPGGSAGSAAPKPIPLADAIARHDLKRMEALLAAGAKLTTPDAGGQTYLHRAATNGDIAVAQALLAHGANPNARNSTGARPLHTAITPAMVKLLVNAKGDPNATDSNGQTPLHTTAARGARDVVEALLDAGARPDMRDKAGKTALDLAVSANHPEAAQLLRARAGAGPAGK